MGRLGFGVLVVCVLSAAVRAQSPASLPAGTHLKFSFDSNATDGVTRVAAGDTYTKEKAFGFDLFSEVSTSPGFVSGKENKPFFFSAGLAPGAYRVTVTLGDPAKETIATVKSETRRLMLEAVHVPAGQSKAFSFLVHIRIPTIPGAAGNAAMVALKPRERDPILYIWDDAHHQTFNELDWDEKLTLEFSDAHPALQSIEITDAPLHTTVYLIGDSTMTDQMMEPWGAWGMQLPRWFKEPVLVANYAECGETTASFISERRWPKVLTELQKGDYVFMQFGINDQRLPVEQFKNYFVRFIGDTQAKGAIPVLVTSQNLRKLDAAGKGVQTLGAFPDAMKQVAAEQKVTLIDLNAMSAALYEAVGPANLPKVFVDGTHQSAYGSYELSKCVVQGIIDAKLPIAKNVVDDWKAFDPTKPDPLDAFHLPVDPQLDPARPGGPGLANGQTAMAAPAPAGRAPATRP